MSQQQQLQMVLAPQLRQSLEMLQLPILELRAMIQQEIEQNPTIELTAPEAPTVEIEPGSGNVDDSKEMEFEKEFEVLARLDDEWRDYFYQNLQNQPYTADRAEKRQFISLEPHMLMKLLTTRWATAAWNCGVCPMIHRVI